MHWNKIIKKEIQKFGLKLKLSRCQKVKKEWLLNWFPGRNSCWDVLEPLEEFIVVNASIQKRVYSN
jgi:adenylate kinase family enzyme